MFAASGLEDPKIANMDKLANSMGLFLQKVNIIRDYREDLDDGRTFWPGEVWLQHASSLSDFTKRENKAQALNCLNALIADTLTLIPDCLEFMGMLKDASVFRFCAIPQVMAISTLALCFDNYKVMEKNVKIRKGLALKLMMESNDLEAVKNTFGRFCGDIAKKLRSDDPNAVDISLSLAKVDALLTQNPL
eukprot:Partr_v1_DN28201_c1_g1_i1_m76225 putative Farnesyl-diphosphate farnesyltransferase